MPDVPQSVVDFLVECATSLRQPEAEHCVEFTVARDAFLAAGVAAMRAAAESGWVQVGLAFRPARHAGLCARLAEAVQMPGVADFFFMHKPPGMRLRLRARGTGRALLAAELDEVLACWRADGLLDGFVPGVYEPEAHLFGGPVSMESVHRLFTADSSLWLAFYADADPGPAWAVSLVMIHQLLQALDVVGWEDRDVWDRVRWQAMRKLPGEARTIGALSAATEAIRRAWADPEALVQQLTPRMQALLDRHHEAVVAEASRWKERYFATREAYVGPREAAAYYIVFHWNRARLSAARQALIAEALAGTAAP